MNIPETLETVTEDFREIGPTVIITSSRFWEDLASKIRVKISDSGAVKRVLYSLSQKIGGKVIDLKTDGIPIPAYLRLLSYITTRIVSPSPDGQVRVSRFQRGLYRRASHKSGRNPLFQSQRVEP